MGNLYAILMGVGVFGGLLVALGAAAASAVASRGGKIEKAVQFDHLTMTAFKVMAVTFVGGWFVALVVQSFSADDDGDAIGGLLLLIAACIYVWLAHTVASAARRKGRSYETFIVLALLFLVIAAIVVAAMRPDRLSEGDFAEVTAHFQSDEGDWVRAGHRSKVLESDLGELGNPIVLLNISDEVTTWVSTDRLRKI